MPPIIFQLNRLQAGRGLLGSPPFRGMGRLPMPATRFIISGVTRDGNGVAIASCVVELYLTSNDMPLEKVTSDANGLYSFSSIGLSEAYYVVAYKAGSPDVAGTTVNTLVGVAG